MEAVKQCKKCGETKPLTEFYKAPRNRDGHFHVCKACWLAQCKEYEDAHREQKRAYQEQYRREKAGKVHQYSRDYYNRNRDQHNTAGRERYRRYCEEGAEQYERLRARGREASRRHRAEDPTFRISLNISRRIRRTLKSPKQGRKWESLVGYRIDDLRAHLEPLFQSGMSWDNYGLHGWHIDHIRPVSSFRFVSHEDEEFKECWALKNLRPLWGWENQRKGKRWKPGEGVTA